MPEYYVQSTKFWEITVKSKSYTTRWGKIGSKGAQKSKDFDSVSECKKAVEKIKKQKVNKGYVLQSSTNKNKKRKAPSDSEQSSEESDDEPPQKKRKMNTSANKKKKQRRESSSEGDESESGFDYNSEDIENEKKLKVMLKESSVLLQDRKKNWQFEILNEGKKNTMIKCKIGSKGRQQLKTFATKTKAFNSALGQLVEKMHFGWTIVSDHSSSESSQSEEEEPPKRRTRKSSKKKKPVSESEEEEESEEDEEGSEIFDGFVFVIQGSNQRGKKSKIENNGGSVKTAVTKSTNFLIVESKNAKLTSSKCKKAKELKVPIVTMQFVIDCIKKDKVINYKSYLATTKDNVDEDSDNDTPMNDVPKTPKKAKKIFAGKNFVVSGSNQQAKIAKIEKFGGKVRKSFNKLADYVVVDSVNPELGSSKCRQAQKAKKPILRFDFIDDCIEESKFLDEAKYVVGGGDDDESESEDEDVTKTKKKKRVSTKEKDESESDEEMKDKEDETKKKSYKKVKISGSVPIDEKCQFQEGWSVFEENGVIWDATLNQTQISSNANKFYKCQILKKDNSEKYAVFFRWGRVGYNGQNNKGGKIYSKAQCIEEFKEKFALKTGGNKWENRDDFKPKKGKYIYLAMDYGNENDANEDSEDEDGDDDEYKKNECELHKDIQDLVQLIFDKNMFEKQLKEIGYDSEKLPLGKLSITTIKKAYAVLKDIEKELKNLRGDSDEDDDEDSDGDDGHKRKKRKSKKKSSTMYDSDEIEELSNRYYTYIPHKIGFARAQSINSIERLKEEMKLVEALSEIEVATKLIKNDKKNKSDKHPIDKHFDLLKCDMESLEKSDKEFKMCENYVHLTHASTHNQYTLDVEKVFKLDRHGSDKRFEPWKDNENRMLLWHGSRLTNFVGIISQGLRIAPPEAPVTGYMFGKGVYFADMCSKSANYCFTSSEANTGLILLCEVALGKMNKLLHADYYAADAMKDGITSTKGQGRTSPDKSTYITLDNGCVVPCGKGKSDNTLQSSLLYNEYIVYDTAQIKMKYLLKLRFNYDDW